jgi:hypothetical protein
LFYHHAAKCHTREWYDNNMGNLATMPMVRGAWVGKCPMCGTCCYFSRFPATNYAGQQVVRLGKFNYLSVRCSCGRRFQTDGDDLLFVTITSLSIQRSSPDSFAVEQNHAGVKIDLGPMSETKLWAYLNSRTLIDIVPSQVLTFLSVASALDLDMVLAVLRPSVAHPQVAHS